ncbi:MAG TPA: hypothetical protein VLT62_08785 [Candidatus Methylomirabilis sp.]|nr:hypothetical protein [Candidatus Methylomirabilis sp.]
MPTITIEVAVLQELLARKAELVRSITAGMASGEWDQVMGAFDSLLVAIQRIEEALETSGRTQAS